MKQIVKQILLYIATVFMIVVILLAIILFHIVILSMKVYFSLKKNKNARDLILRPEEANASCQDEAFASTMASVGEKV